MGLSYTRAALDSSWNANIHPTSRPGGWWMVEGGGSSRPGTPSTAPSSIPWIMHTTWFWGLTDAQTQSDSRRHGKKQSFDHWVNVIIHRYLCDFVSTRVSNKFNVEIEILGRVVTSRLFYEVLYFRFKWTVLSSFLQSLLNKKLVEDLLPSPLGLGPSQVA